MGRKTSRSSAPIRKIKPNRNLIILRIAQVLKIRHHCASFIQESIRSGSPGARLGRRLIALHAWRPENVWPVAGAYSSSERAASLSGGERPADALQRLALRR